MDEQPKNRLPIGRAAFAKAFCSDWILDHFKKGPFFFALLLVAGFCLFQWSGGLPIGTKSDYFEVQKAFNVWSSKEVQDLNLFKNLEKPLGRHCELQAKFGTQIAQRLLGLGDVRRAYAYATSALKRSKNLTSPYYSQFTRNTLLISQGQYVEALKEAKRMKESLEKDDVFWEGRDKFVRSGTILYAYNLLRIASLERQLDFKEGELIAWIELEQNAGWKERPVNMKTYDPEAYHLLAQNFNAGDVSLLDFIEQRKKELTR